MATITVEDSMRDKVELICRELISYTGATIYPFYNVEGVKFKTLYLTKRAMQRYIEITSNMFKEKFHVDLIWDGEAFIIPYKDIERINILMMMLS